MHRRTFVAVALAAAFALPALAQKPDTTGAIVIGQSVPLSGSNKQSAIPGSANPTKKRWNS